MNMKPNPRLEYCKAQAMRAAQLAKESHDKQHTDKEREYSQIAAFWENRAKEAEAAA